MDNKLTDWMREKGYMSMPVHSIAGYTFLRNQLEANLNNGEWVAQQTEETLTYAHEMLAELNTVLEEVDPHE
jgi:hypothetical protein